MMLVGASVTAAAVGPVASDTTSETLTPAGNPSTRMVMGPTGPCPFLVTFTASSPALPAGSTRLSTATDKSNSGTTGLTVNR